MNREIHSLLQPHNTSDASYCQLREHCQLLLDTWLLLDFICTYIKNWLNLLIQKSWLPSLKNSKTKPQRPESKMDRKIRYYRAKIAKSIRGLPDRPKRNRWPPSHIDIWRIQNGYCGEWYCCRKVASSYPEVERNVSLPLYLTKRLTDSKDSVAWRIQGAFTGANDEAAITGNVPHVSTWWKYIGVWDQGQERWQRRWKSSIGRRSEGM